jgi:hypothetical protein
MAEIPVLSLGDEVVALRPIRAGDASAWSAAFAEDVDLKHNAAAIAFAEGMGFPLEGRLRKRNLEHGRRVDMLIWGVLREEWQARPPR